jgi:hypothetical protein
MLRPDIAVLLRASHQAGEGSRAGKFWFCFYPPALAGESGVGHFFRHWGGEALYNLHEDDPVTSAVLAALGMPCPVLTEVPIALFGNSFSLARSIVRRFLTSQGHQIDEPVACEGYIVSELPAGNIHRVVRFPRPEFLSLTGRMDWKRPLV